jgi:hypothetical protein
MLVHTCLQTNIYCRTVRPAETGVLYVSFSTSEVERRFWRFWAFTQCKLVVLDFELSRVFWLLYAGRYIYLPMKMEQTECSETSAYKIQTPGNYPGESIQQVGSSTLVDLHLDAQNSYLFTYNTFIKILYMFRALPCSPSRSPRRNCIYATSGIVTLCRWLSCAPVKKEFFLNRCTRHVEDFNKCIICNLESFEMWCWRRMEKISWTDHMRNEDVLLRFKEQRNILHEIRKRKAN